MQRKSGILMPVFSLPSPYGIGDFGSGAYNFIDYLKKANQSIWQILPLAPTGAGNSPYSSISSKSISPLYISLEFLVNDNLLTPKEVEFSLKDGDRVDYEFLNSVRIPLLKKAFERFDKKRYEFLEFVNKKTALNYAIFSAIKGANGNKDFRLWQTELKFRNITALENFCKDYINEILFWQFIQFIAQNQWLKLKKYANENGIEIIGDMPLYVSIDSVDVWENPNLFKLDKNLNPTVVAGVPPDYFCEDGQLWGNPVFDYAVHKLDNFKWWQERVEYALQFYDYVRIDHFRGLNRYYEIPASSDTAKIGEWIEVPEDELFNAIHKRVDKNRIIAEDLGIIDDKVRNLLSKTGYPGMKILSFAFNGEKDNLYLPENVEENSICYTGTHDNNTLLGLIESLNEWDYNNLKFGVQNSLKLAQIERDISDNISLCSAIIELGFYSQSKIFIMPMQDVLLMNSNMRINTPGQVSELNWSVRFNNEHLTIDSLNMLKNLTQKYGRN